MNFLLFIPFVLAIMFVTVWANKLTKAGAIAGGFIATAIFSGVGWIGIILLGAFFVAGTTATSWGKRTKEKIGLAQENKGRRNAGQVWANGGVGGLLGLLAFIFPQQKDLYLLLIAASFSSAAADTLSSELGSIYGHRFYDILTLKKGQRGNDGVVSIEGFLFGLMGSLLIAALYSLNKGWSSLFLWIIVAGTFGNVADSILGATLERKKVLQNDVVNLLNTAAAALFMLLLVL